jgi:hypothetical protein
MSASLCLVLGAAQPADGPTRGVSIWGFYPQSGAPGATVYLFGSGLGKARQVTFGGAAASFKVLGRREVSAVVPAGARTGPITVVTSQGTATSSTAFTVQGQAGPTLTSFTPGQGLAGTVVTLTGTGFTAGATVAFHGAAAAVTFVSATQLKATVPAGATTGPITVTTPAGTATSAAAFAVTQVAGPTLTAFTPTQGPVGTVVTLVGTGFTAGATVAFHGTPAPAVTFVSATQLQATVPAGATSGSISVTTAAGTATSPAAFTVTQVVGAPTLTSFSPTQGPVGTAVTLTGTGFTPGATVAFHGTAATAVTYGSATQLTATVPAGATTGTLSVTTAAGTGASSSAFTVQTAPSGVDLSVGAWYLSQSVQTLARSIPLVAGKDGYLRVFALASGSNALAPKVRVTVTGGSPSPWVQTINAPAAAVPTAVAEDNLASSWNLAIPGAVIAVGGTLKVELDPDGAIPESNKANNTVTAALDARALAVFRTTIIPVTQQGLTGNVTNGRTLASWGGLLNALYPIAGIDVALGSPYTTQANLNTGSDGWNTLLGDLNNKRVADGTNRYYYGAVSVSYSGGLAGLGYIGAPTAIGWDKGGYDQVFAHETGHNFGRSHAPCGLTGADSGWPTDAAHASAAIGVYGLDTRTGEAKAPSAFKDLMSYCGPVWVSDYTYKGVLDYRTAGHLAEDLTEGALPARTDCLLISGTVRNGQLALDPAYFVHTRPTAPRPGAYVLELKDRHGATLLKVPFGAVPIADSDCGHQGFAFAIPLDCALQTAYQALRVITPTGGLVQRNAGPGDVFQLPTATQHGPHVARIQWDAKAFPTAMIRNPATQEVLAFAREGLLDLATDAKTLEVTLSDGVRSKKFLLKLAE